MMHRDFGWRRVDVERVTESDQPPSQCNNAKRGTHAKRDTHASSTLVKPIP